MKRMLLFITLVSLVISGCAISLNRQGYDVKHSVNRAPSDDCKVAIKMDLVLGDYDYELLGEIEAYDNALTIECCERYVLSLFLADACEIGANVINIVEEQKPAWMESGCYRAKAQLIKIRDEKQAASINTDFQYSLSLVEYRSQISHRIQQTGLHHGPYGCMLADQISPFWPNTEDDD